jgi:hypothetical protein
MKAMLFAVLVITGTPGTTWGQSKNDFASRYKPIYSYEIRRGFLMVAQFDSQGDVCEVVITKDATSSDNQKKESMFSNQIADELLNELSPPSVRGRANEWLDPDSILVGNSYFDKQDYENISVERKGVAGEGLESLRIIWVKRRCANAVSPASGK